MATKRPAKVSLTRRQQKILEEFANGRKCPRGLSNRSRIILYWAEGRGVRETARDMAVDSKTVLSWRQRWMRAEASWGKAQRKWMYKELREKIRGALADAPRSGAPAKFTAEAVCQIISVACKLPKELGVPVSHWSASDLRRQVLKEGIVEEISVRQVGRFLKRLTSDRTACATG
jgi:putative transposase